MASDRTFRCLPGPGWLTRGTFQVNARAVPFADVDQAWADAATSSQRIVLVPLALIPVRGLAAPPGGKPAASTALQALLGHAPVKD